MADLLGLAGKIDAMGGIEATIYQVTLYSSTDVAISTTLASGATHFNTNATTGQLKNTVAALDFTIEVADVGLTASYVLLQNVSVETLIRIDLETPVSLTTAGTATIAIGDLTADL